MVVVETTFDANVSKVLNKATFKNLTIFFVLISLVFIMLGLVELMDGDLFGCCLWIIFGILYIPLVLILTKLIQKRTNKTCSVLSDETIERYEFTEDFIFMKQQKGDDYYSETKTKYNYLFKAIETKEEFILYISNVQAHIVPKSKIIEGSIGELRELLRKNLNDKFKELNKHY